MGRLGHLVWGLECLSLVEVLSEVWVSSISVLSERVVSFV